MTASQRIALLVALVAAAAWGASVPAAHAAPGDGIVTVKTVPAVEGMRFLYQGRVLRADARGRLQLQASHGSLRQRLKVQRTRLGPGAYATFGRFYSAGSTLNVTTSFYYLLRPRFINLQGKTVDPRVVSSALITGRQGKTYTFRGGQRRWVQGTRVTARANIHGRQGSDALSFRVKRLEYGITEAIVEGSNVVHAGQQRLVPAKGGDVRFRLLLFTAHFQTKDAFFGFPIGSAIKLTHPSGRVQRIELESGGDVTIPSLPRGDYEVAVDGPGFSFTRPVALSRNQEVELDVFSYVDVGLVLFVMAAFILGLPLLSRPHLFAAIVDAVVPRSLRRRREPRPTAAEGA